MMRAIDRLRRSVALINWPPGWWIAAALPFAVAFWVWIALRLAGWL